MVDTLTGKSPEILEELFSTYTDLAKRERELEDCLQKAQQEKGSVNERIFEKVIKGYKTDLGNVRSDLVPLQIEISELKREARKQLGDLEPRIKELQDVLAELMFRYRVGEYDDVEYEDKKELVESRTEELSRQRDEVIRKMEALGMEKEIHLPAEDAAPTRYPVPDSETNSRPEKPVPAWRDLDRDFDQDGDQDRDQDLKQDLDEGIRQNIDQDFDQDFEEDADQDENQEQPEPPAEPESTSEDIDFVNPNEWLREMGRDAKAAPKTATLKPKPGVKDFFMDDDDPLSALADPSDEQTKRSRAEADRPSGYPNLVIVSGPNAGKKIPLLPMTMSVGREHDNNIELKDPDVARYHARVLYERGVFVLEDLESSTGTLLNGAAIKKSPIKKGDKVKFGNTELKIEFD